MEVMQEVVAQVERGLVLVDMLILYGRLNGS